jgi:hypothetical protein
MSMTHTESAMHTEQIAPEAEIKTDADTHADAFVPGGPADQELEWLFTLAEADMGDRSYFLDGLVGVSKAEMDAMLDARVEAAHAQRTLLAWIRELDDFDAGVLQTAYIARPWPLALREELGRLTAIAVRLGSAEAGLPDSREALDALDLQTALRLDEALGREPHTVMRLAEQARPLLQRAFEAFLIKRGGADAPLLPGVT